MNTKLIKEAEDAFGLVNNEALSKMSRFNELKDILLNPTNVDGATLLKAVAEFKVLEMQLTLARESLISLHAQLTQKLQNAK